MPRNIELMNRLINTYRDRIPIYFDKRWANEHYTPSAEQSSVLDEGCDLGQDLPWCKFTQERDKRGKRNTSYNKQTAAAIFFELAPNIFEAMELGDTFVTSVMIAMYHCYPCFSRKTDRPEEPCSGFVPINESARCGKRPRKDLIDPNAGKPAKTLIPERRRNSFTDDQGQEWVSEQQLKRMNLNSQLRPNSDPDDTNRGQPTLNKQLKKIIAQCNRYDRAPFAQNSFLSLGDSQSNIIESSKIEYQALGKEWWNCVAGSSRMLHPLVDPQTYANGEWSERDPLSAVLNQDEEFDPTSVFHRVRERHGVAPFDPSKSLKDPTVIKEITDNITQYLESILQDNLEYRALKEEWILRL